MEKKLNEYLREGETIRWQGQPANFPLMDNGSRMQILRKWALTVIIAAGALIAHMQSQMPPRMGLVAVVVACALVVVLTPVVEKASLMKNKYWITNQRIIHMTKGGMFYYMDLDPRAGQRHLCRCKEVHPLAGKSSHGGSRGDEEPRSCGRHDFLQHRKLCRLRCCHSQGSGLQTGCLISSGFRAKLFSAGHSIASSKKSPRHFAWGSFFAFKNIFSPF